MKPGSAVIQMPITPPPLSAASEAVMVLNKHGVIRFATPAAARFYGYQPEDMLGRSALRFVAPENVEAAQSRWQAFVDDPDRQSDEIYTVLLSTSGYRVPIRVSAWRLPGQDEYLLVHHILDHLRDRLETIYAIQAAVASTAELGELLDTVLREIHRLIPCDTSTLFIVQRDGSLQARRWRQQQLQIEQLKPPTHQPEFETSRIVRESNAPLIISDTLTDARWTTVPDKRPIRSWLGAPLRHAGIFMGEMTLDSTQPNAFTSDDAELAHALATQVAAALHHARQYQDEQRRADRFRALSEISQAINDLDLRSMLELVYRKISSLMDTSTFFIGLYDAETGLVRLVGAYDYDLPSPDEVQPADQGITGQVIRTRQPVIVVDAERDPLPEAAIIAGENPRSLLMMPLITRDEVIGVISVQSYVPNAYNDEDIHMLGIIAESVATAVRNAQLYDQALERLNALEVLHQMNLNLVSAQDPEEVCALIALATLDLFKCGQVCLSLSQEEPKRWVGEMRSRQDTLRLEVVRGQAVGSLVDQVRRTNTPVTVHNMAQQPELRAEFETGWPVQAVAIYPILRGSRQLATLTLYYHEPQVFRRDTLRTLDLLCHQASSALENARSTVTLRRRLSEVSALHDLARRVSSMDSLEAMLQTVVDTLRRVYQCKSASIALIDPEGREVVTLAGANLEQRYIDGARFAMGEYVAGQVAATGQVIYVPDTELDPRYRAVDPGVRSLMVVPLTVQGRVIGTLGIDGSEPGAFTKDHERVLTIAAGQIAAAIETARLLQEARLRADQLARANASLEAQDEFRRELVYQVSHDLRGPLQIVYGYADMMRDEMLGPVTVTQKEVLSLIVKRSKAIERLTRDIMAARPISREALELDTVNLTEICQQTLADAQMMYQDEKYHFVSAIAPLELSVEADYNRLSRVFDNLIGNAVKFSPDGGSITLKTTRDDGQGCALVSICDEGIGIAPDKLPFIFERFYRGDKAFRQRFDGSGLGLFNVQQIIEAHNGRVWAESNEGVGSTFSFALPLK